MTQNQKNFLSLSQPMTNGESLVSFEGAIAAYTGEQSTTLLIWEGERWKAALPLRGIYVSERMARLERDPKKAAALARARGRLGQAAEKGARPTISSLRLNAGLSQAQLAERLGTQQGNISRWEREPTELQVTTILRLAAALGVSDTVIFEIVKAAVKEQAIEA